MSRQCPDTFGRAPTRRPFLLPNIAKYGNSIYTTGVHMYFGIISSLAVGAQIQTSQGLN